MRSNDLNTYIKINKDESTQEKSIIYKIKISFNIFDGMAPIQSSIFQINF